MNSVLLGKPELQTQTHHLLGSGGGRGGNGPIQPRTQRTSHKQTKIIHKYYKQLQNKQETGLEVEPPLLLFRILSWLGVYSTLSFEYPILDLSSSELLNSFCIRIETTWLSNQHTKTPTAIHSDLAVQDWTKLSNSEVYYWCPYSNY